MKFYSFFWCLIGFLCLVPVQAHDGDGADEIKEIYAQLLYLNPDRFAENREKLVNQLLVTGHEAAELTPPFPPGSKREKVAQALLHLADKLEIQEHDGELKLEKFFRTIHNGVWKLPYTFARHVRPEEIIRSVGLWYNTFTPLADRLEQSDPLTTAEELNLFSNKFPLKRHLLNMALLFPASHMMEMTLGPLLGPYLAKSIGTELSKFTSSFIYEFGSSSSPVFEGILEAGGVMGGLIISIPGFDPLCLFIIGTYIGNKYLRRVWMPIMKYPNALVFHGSSRLFDTFNRTNLLKRFLKEEKVIETLIKNIKRDRDDIKVLPNKRSLNFEVSDFLLGDLGSLEFERSDTGSYFLRAANFTENAWKLSEGAFISKFNVLPKKRFFHNPLEHNLKNIYRFHKAGKMPDYLETAFHILTSKGKVKSNGPGPLRLTFARDAIRLPVKRKCWRGFTDLLKSPQTAAR